MSGGYRDITHCLDHACPMRRRCWRYGETDSPQQSYTDFRRPPERAACTYLIAPRAAGDPPEGPIAYAYRSGL